MATRERTGGRPRPRRTIAGTWRSELGSELELHHTDGFLSGRYRSVVGTVRQSQSLIGFCTPPTGIGRAVLGFVVCWSDTGSVTSWTGRYDGESDQLQLTWVLETATPPATAWRATQVGQDTFHRSAVPVGMPREPMRAAAGSAGTATA